MSDVKAKILKLISKKNEISGSDIASAINESPQLVSYHIKKLRSEGKVTKSGSTRNAKFKLPSSKDKKKVQKIEIIRKLKGLEEDRVFSEIEARMSLKKRINKNAYDCLQFGFTEMLNNAIDHSKSLKVSVCVEVSELNASFTIRDYGVGLVQKIQKNFKVANGFEALEHVLKGKQTTDPERHTGQGIFFTSRLFDSFRIQSDTYNLSVDNLKQDRFITESKKIKGTLVRVSTSKNTKKNIADVFSDYSNDEYEFDKSSITVTLSTVKGLVSRSQAKRIITGLSDFDRIEFNFKGVKGIGQAFADEVFRIYARQNPKKILSYTHANKAVAYMIERARK